MWSSVGTSGGMSLEHTVSLLSAPAFHNMLILNVLKLMATLTDSDLTPFKLSASPLLAFMMITCLLDPSKYQDYRNPLPLTQMTVLFICDATISALQKPLAHPI